MNDNGEIFEVPGVYENARRQTLTLALTVCAKCLKYMKLVQNKKKLWENFAVTQAYTRMAYVIKITFSHVWDVT